MATSLHLHVLLAGTALATGVLVALSAPATAAVEVGTGQRVIADSTAGHACPLRRVGDHLVRCDDVTGAGRAAPRWIRPL